IIYQYAHKSNNSEKTITFLASFFGEILTSFLTSPYLRQIRQNQTNFRTKFPVLLSFDQPFPQDIDRNAKSL
ncbi:MAG: hypothetical protein ACYSYL_17755, partial [Planctomycetota bacterium]